MYSLATGHRSREHVASSPVPKFSPPRVTRIPGHFPVARRSHNRLMRGLRGRSRSDGDEATFAVGNVAAGESRSSQPVGVASRSWSLAAGWPCRCNGVSVAPDALEEFSAANRPISRVSVSTSARSVGATALRGTAHTVHQIECRDGIDCDVAMPSPEGIKSVRRPMREEEGRMR